MKLATLKPRVQTLKATRVQQLAPANPDSWRAGKTTAERGYGSKWQRARAQYLREHPLCAMCKAEGAIGLATVVDHIIPHEGDEKLFWSRSNWQPLCKRHHDSDAQRKDNAIRRGRV